MKKTTITISYDEEKLNALKLYLKQKNMNLDDELIKSLDTLFNKTVPAGVREFINMKSKNTAEASKVSQNRNSSSAVGKSEREIKTNG